MTPTDDRTPDPDEPVTDLDLARAHALLADPAVWVEPDPALEDRVFESLRLAARQATDRHDAAAAPPAPAVPPAPPAPAVTSGGPSAGGRVLVPGAKASSRWRPRLAGAAVGLAAASALFVGVAVAHRPAAPNLRLSLAATPLAPSASGQAKLTETSSGWRIELDTKGLVRLDQGRYYEAWLEGPKGIVSIGTFHTGAAVVLWAGVEADEYTSLTVTIEQEDGDPASSLQRVLTAGIKR